MRKMNRNGRKLSGAVLLLAIALASFAVAAITITNVTEWNIMAKAAPIKKVKGDDIAILAHYGVNIELDTSNNYNKTKITLVGFIGDPTNYTSVLKICNVDTQRAYDVRLVYRGLVGGYSWDHVAYVVLHFDGEKLQLDSNANEGDATSYVRIGSATKSGDKVEPTCKDVGADILVKPTATDGATVIAFLVDVESSPTSP
ncbi:MAG: hypothetical protein QXQ60_00785 [Thermofilum sp.]